MLAALPPPWSGLQGFNQVDITIQCERCGHRLSIDVACSGMLMKCVRCSADLVIPGESQHPLLPEELHAADLASADTLIAGRKTVVVPCSVAVVESIETPFDSFPAEDETLETRPARLLSCPFCVESMRRRKTHCRVCGNPLTLLPGNTRRPSPFVLAAAIAAFVVGALVIAILSSKVH